MNKKMNNKGFSLVELIIVIMIMAILVGLLVPQFIKYVERSRQAADLQNVQELKTAIEVYATDGTLTGDPTITIKNKQATVDDANGKPAVEAAGLNSNVTLKSDWGATAVTYKFNHTSLNWGTPSNCTNSKDPHYNIQSVFQ